MNGARLRVPVNDRDHIQGSPDAPVTLLEYGDYECPHCLQAYPIVRRARRAMGDQLRLVFRHFPLNQQHSHSMDAAAAAEAAGLQGRFWDMHHVLFSNHDNLDPASLHEYALELRLDIDRFDQDIRSRQLSRKIDADLESGLRSGVNGTPTFFVNGYRFDGDWAEGGFLEALREAALAGVDA